MALRTALTGLLIVAPLLCLAAVPRPASPPPGAMNRAATAPAAVAPNPLMQALPQQWGNPEPAKRPVPVAKGPEKASRAIVPLPPAKSLARMPVGRVQIGDGRVDPNSTMRHSAVYVIRAQSAGIVEYLYDQTGLTRMGQPLVRLYDLSILSDLHIGESIMARFATSPFVIAPRQAGLPPLPPPNFPRPTVLQRLLGIIPAPRPTLATQETIQAPARAQLAPSGNSGLARSSGLQARSPETETTEGPVNRPAIGKTAKSAGVVNITRTTADITEARDRISELNSALTKVEVEIGQVEEELQEARDDAGARERLYKQGVLARNLYEAAQRKVSELESELQGLKARRAETTEARETALQRLSSLQDQLDQQVSNNRQEADQERIAPRPGSGLASTREAPARRTVERPAPRAYQAPSGFPDPTQPSRPELRRLPRVAGPRRSSSSVFVGAREIPTVPVEVKRLAEPRWVDQCAPGEGLVVRQLVPPGSQVVPGQPLLEVANREFARVYTDIPSEDAPEFRLAAPIRITFDSYPGVLLQGWINDVEPIEKTALMRVEMVVTAQEGYYPEDTYASLEWLALAAPLTDEDNPEPVTQASYQTPAGAVGPTTIYELMPLVPPSVGPANDTITQTKDDEYVGLVRMAELDAQAPGTYSNPANAQRLAKLREWRESFTAGMQTGIFGNLVLSYPRDREVGDAVERMASGRVSHIPNRCAGTMREALGWGLGDAAVWLRRLPERGYKPRKDGLARPGDILVWPFTYGGRQSQHIGIAVNQGGRLMLLSNLGGTLGTTELLGGYVAFYKPEPKTIKQPITTKPVAIRKQLAPTAR